MQLSISDIIANSKSLQSANYAVDPDCLVKGDANEIKDLIISALEHLNKNDYSAARSNMVKIHNAIAPALVPGDYNPYDSNVGNNIFILASAINYYGTNIDTVNGNIRVMSGGRYPLIHYSLNDDINNFEYRDLYFEHEDGLYLSLSSDDLSAFEADLAEELEMAY